MLNNEIKAKRVLVIDETGATLGQFMIRDAINLAEERGLDLVQMSKDDNLPTCKIMDHGKFIYEKKKNEKKAKARQVVQETKEIRLSPRTEENDLQTKCRTARGFISDGDRVKITVRYRGREAVHMDIVKRQAHWFQDQLSDVADLESNSLSDGSYYILLVPKKN